MTEFKYCDNDLCSPETAKKIDAFLDKYPMARYGPGHSALDDFNLSDGSIRLIVRLIEAVIAGKPSPDEKDDFVLDLYTIYDPEEHPADELKATRLFLNELLLIPEDDR